MFNVRQLGLISSSLIIGYYVGTNEWKENVINRLRNYGKKSSELFSNKRTEWPKASTLRYFDDYILRYDHRTRNPMWVYEHITSNHLKYPKNVDRGNSRFYSDPLIHEYFRSSKDDFFRSSFDRGHMAPAVLHRLSQNDLDDTFCLSNISPQVGIGFNRDKWCALELTLRNYAKQSQNSYIITGPLFLPDKNQQISYRTIGKNGIAVPTHFFKIALYERMDKRIELFSFVMENSKQDDSIDLRSYLVPPDAIERSSDLFEKMLNEFPNNEVGLPDMVTNYDVDEHRGVYTVNDGHGPVGKYRTKHSPPPNGRSSVELVNRQMSNPRLSYGKDEHPNIIQTTNLSSAQPTTTNDQNKKKVAYANDENQSRGNWSGRFDFLLSCLGYAVGLGNVWRFPYICYRNGGGAFLIPYLIFLLFVGVPVFFLELNIGQYTSRGPSCAYSMVPYFQGIGVCMVIVAAFLCIYYNMIIAWSLYYLVACFTKVLPWQKCKPEWIQRDNCVDTFTKDYITTNFVRNKTDESCPVENLISTSNKTIIGCIIDGKKKYNSFELIMENNGVSIPSENYFRRTLLNTSDSMDDTGTISGKLVGALVVSWIIVFLCMVKGIKSSGKVVYFTALFPYLVLVILGIKGWTLDGAKEGIIYFIKPNLSLLKKASIWNDAASQIFFSLSTCFGGLIALASYNKFNNDTLKDTFIVTLSNSATSIFAGLVMFSYLGNLSYTSNIDIRYVAKSGPGLAFVVYPFAVTTIKPPPLWAAVFFIMLITLGLDSSFASLETVITGLMDQWPKLKAIKSIVILITCTIMCLFGLIFCTQAGQFWVEFFSFYSGGFAVLILAIIECLSITWIYGWNNWYEDILLMLGEKYRSKAMMIWRVFWGFISPSIILFCLIYQWVKISIPEVENKELPKWANSLGYCMTVFILTPLIVMFFVKLIKIKRKGKSLKSGFKFSRSWGPALEKHRKLVHHLPDFDPLPVDSDDDNGESTIIKKIAKATSIKPLMKKMKEKFSRKK
ncbi:hypothetical protein SNEBB_000866 [Seison nebaliae]|nr:hypothetical protein SNEBB_000866 [Seison nebaliae]